jgi:hypothetical protein
LRDATIRTMCSIVALLALSACSANTYIASNTAAGVGSAATGTTVVAGGVSASVVGGSAAGALGAAGVLGNLFYRGSEPLDRAPPPLLKGRKVNEQDCTKPLVDYSANLRCR